MEVNNAFIDFDREYIGASNNNSSSTSQKCYACERLDKGQGGENQMEHMEPGGCLYEEFYEEFNEDSFVETKQYNKGNNRVVTKENKNDKICIICKLKSSNFKNDSYICDSCDIEEEKTRYISYQNFVVSF